MVYLNIPPSVRAVDFFFSLLVSFSVINKAPFVFHSSLSEASINIYKRSGSVWKNQVAETTIATAAVACLGPGFHSCCRAQSCP